MVLARSLEEWLEKLRAEAHAEEKATWVEWSNRRIAAQENNGPFDEPPPSADRQN